VTEIVAELRGRYQRVDDEEVRLFLDRLAARRCVEVGHG
jgi:pyrroloquinoline quinone biosynthesis protein D